MNCLGHMIFMFLHLLAILFGCGLLIITVPLHLIFAAVVQNRGG